MLGIAHHDPAIGRRRFLTIGALGLGGLSLPSVSALRAASGGRSALTGRSVVFLFLQGGPSQHETFDPKLDAPAGTRTVGGVVPTSVSGVSFGATLERLAGLAHRLTVVRSFHTGNGGHNIQPIVGPDSLDANIGVHYSRVAGATRPATGVPTNAVIFPRAVRADVPKPEARGDISATGPYGSGYAPFIPGADGELQQDMELSVPPERFGDRRHLLAELDRLERRIDASGRLEGFDDVRRQAYEILLGGGVARALDLSREDPATVARYDTSRFAQEGRWDEVSRGRKGYYTAQARTIGHLLLLARRLCEAGCGYVTIHAGYAGVWDMHADGNNLNMADGMEAVGRSFDHAVAAFVEDVTARGLEKDILLVITGEMGRTPRINKRGGRDHWARLAPLVLFGGGAEPGRVVGRSDRAGGEPTTDAYGPKRLISTILHTVLDASELRLEPSVPSEVLRLMQPEPIPGTV